MPKADASLPSARERRLYFATPAMESTMASRKFRSFSFCPRTNGSSFFCLLFLEARISWAAFAGPKSFRAPFVLGDLPGCSAIFLAGFFGAGFFAAFDDLAGAFLGNAFFTGALDFSVVLELFFLAEMAIFGSRPSF